MATYSEGAKLGIPVGLAVKTGAPIVALSARFNGSTDEAVQADLAALPGALDKIDAWIDDGTLGGDPPNAADLQIGTSLRLLMSFEDLRPAIESRPAGRWRCAPSPTSPGAHLRHSRTSGSRRFALPSPSPVEGLLFALTLAAALGCAASGRRGRRGEEPRLLALAERVERVLQLRTVRQRQRRVELEQRKQHEPARAHLGVRQRQAVGLELDIAEQQQVEVDRARAVARAARTRGPGRPRSACRRRAAPRAQGEVVTLAAAFRKSGWSSTSPTGSVSYREETASTSMPSAASAASAAEIWASRSPTLEPRPM